MDNAFSSRSVSSNRAHPTEFIVRLRKSKNGLIQEEKFLIDAVPHLSEGQGLNTDPLSFLRPVGIASATPVTSPSNFGPTGNRTRTSSMPWMRNTTLLWALLL